MKYRLLLLGLLLPALLHAKEQPHILWITSEDNSPYLGCYGDELAQTPNIDGLAAEGIRYDRAFSNAPVCSVARTTLLMGVYPVSLGLQHHRSKYPVPEGLTTYPQKLRKAGYYCTNNSKTDYNVVFKGKPKIWDESSGKAHYKNRKEGQPFFAVFNFTNSHESATFPGNMERKRKSGQLPAKNRVSPLDLPIPPYHPDIPEVRQEWADYYDCVTDMDRQVGKVLKELDERGLADDTIVFYYGDHGGSLARGKRSMMDSGTRVPLVIRFGRNWQHLAPGKPGEASRRLVSFVDFGPTVLSLAGVEVPDTMDGRPFLGNQEQAARKHVFLYRGRMDERYDEIRGVRTADHLYVRNYAPHLPYGQHYSYAYNSLITPAWEKAFQEGKCDEVQSAYWKPKPTEEFYDARTDPHMVKNLIDDPKQVELIASHRRMLDQEMAGITDSVYIPEAMYRAVAGDGSLGDFLRNSHYPGPRLKIVAEAAISRDLRKLPVLINALKSTDSLQRYWAALGCLIRGEKVKVAATYLEQVLDDENAAVRVTAAHALGALGRKEKALQVLRQSIDSEDDLEVLIALHALEDFPGDWARFRTRLEEIAQRGKRGNAPRVAEWMLEQMKETASEQSSK